MPQQGKILYPDACAPQGKPKFDGGGSRGKSAKFKGGAATALPKQEGTPRDKGVNR